MHHKITSKDIPLLKEAFRNNNFKKLNNLLKALISKCKDSSFIERMKKDRLRTLSCVLFDVVFSQFSLYSYIKLRQKTQMIDRRNPGSKEVDPTKAAEQEKRIKEIESLITPKDFYDILLSMFDLAKIDKKVQDEVAVATEEKPFSLLQKPTYILVVCSLLKLASNEASLMTPFMSDCLPRIFDIRVKDGLDTKLMRQTSMLAFDDVKQLHEQMLSTIKRLLFFKTEQTLKHKNSKAALNISWQPEENDFKSSEYPYSSFMDYFKFMSTKNPAVFNGVIKEACETK